MENGECDPWYQESPNANPRERKCHCHQSFIGPSNGNLSSPTLAHSREPGEIRGQTGRSPFSVPIREWLRLPRRRKRQILSRIRMFLAIFLLMARFARVVVVDVPHHVTQRGNARRVILAHDAARLTYLELLRQYSALHRLSLLGYCFMSNHVHLIVIPRAPDSLAQTLKHTHG